MLTDSCPRGQGLHGTYPALLSACLLYNNTSLPHQLSLVIMHIDMYIVLLLSLVLRSGEMFVFVLNTGIACVYVWRCVCVIHCFLLN